MPAVPSTSQQYTGMLLLGGMPPQCIFMDLEPTINRPAQTIDRFIERHLRTEHIPWCHIRGDDARSLAECDGFLILLSCLRSGAMHIYNDPKEQFHSPDHFTYWIVWWFDSRSTHYLSIPRPSRAFHFQSIQKEACFDLGPSTDRYSYSRDNLYLRDTANASSR